MRKRLRGLCRSTQKEPSKLCLEGPDSNGPAFTSDKMRVWFEEWLEGLRTYFMFEQPMWLGILHVFLIRGWSTLLCHDDAR